MLIIDLIFGFIIVGLTYIIFQFDGESLSLRFGVSLFFSLIVLLFWALVSGTIAIESEKERVFRSQYEIHRSHSKVFFSLEDKKDPITRSEHYIYEHAEDTSRVYITRERGWNRFGYLIKDDIDLQTNK